MAPKFDLNTADMASLKDRVRQLTSAIVKQKEQIEKLRSAEHQLAGDKEKLERQVRDLQEEAAMSREMRASLQGEVARLQRALEHQTAEADMLRSEMEAASSQHLPGDPHDIPVASQDELVAELRKTAHDAEGRAAAVESEMRRYRDESHALSEELETLRDTLDEERRRWAAAAGSSHGHRPLQSGPSPVHAPAKTAGGGNEAAEDCGVGTPSGTQLSQANSELNGDTHDAYSCQPTLGVDAGMVHDAVAGESSTDAAVNGGRRGIEAVEVEEGGKAAGQESAHADDHGEAHAARSAAPADGSSAGEETWGMERMREKLAGARSKCRELEEAVSSLNQELAQAAARRAREEEEHESERKRASARQEALAASLERAQKTHQQAQLYIRELEAQRDERGKEVERLHASIKERSQHEGSAAARTTEEVGSLRTKLSQLLEQLEGERSKALGLAAQVERMGEAAAAAEEELARRVGMFESDRARWEQAVKRAEGRELAARKEAEAGRKAAAEEKVRCEAMREETKKQVSMDRSIVKGLQAEMRHRAADAEAALQVEAECAPARRSNTVTLKTATVQPRCRLRLSVRPHADQTVNCEPSTVNRKPLAVSRKP